MNTLLIIVGKLVFFLARILNLGAGSTWPGHIVLSVNKNFIRDLLQKNKHLKVVLIAGTNGKTTTTKLIQTILEHDGKKVFRNISGANLLNGIASSLILRSSILSKVTYNFVIFEVDENTLPHALNEVTPHVLLLLNLFRDQLDRYGEVDTIVHKWAYAVKNVPKSTTVMLNADDPQIAILGKKTKARVLYFGLSEKKLAQEKSQHASDSTYCPNCGKKLHYKTIYFSHLGNWECKNCNIKRPDLNNHSSPLFPLSGVYNRYNTIAAVLFAKDNNVSNETLEQSLKKFTPAFGRQEKLTVDRKTVQFFLSKNPTSFNQSLRTIRELGARNLLIVLNDRIPDGRDVSWIWDVDFEELGEEQIIVSGDRAYDMALRLKYLFETQNYGSKLKMYENLKEATDESLNELKEDETLYILPTYSAMLEVRKILTGRKLL